MAALRFENQSQGNRLSELDGLRGWASLSVLLFHIFWETFGDIVPGFRNIFTAGLFNGALSVAIFFVLSGEALSASYWRTEDRRSMLRLALKRYPRLTIPIFVSTLIIVALMKSGLNFSDEAAVIIRRVDWLGSFLQFSPDWIHFLRYSLFDVYGSVPTGNAFNPLLWTMRVELLGSFVVFLILLTERPLARGWSMMPIAVIVALAIMFFVQKSLLACFPFGVLFGWMRARGYFTRLRTGAWLPALSIVMLLVVLAYSGHKQFVGHSGARPFTIAAVCFVFFAHCQTTTTNFLRNNPLSHFLGKISFPLYLVHFPIIISLTSFLIVFAKSHAALTAGTAFAIAVLSVAASIGAAVLFLPVEALTQRVCRWTGFLLPARDALSHPPGPAATQSRSLIPAGATGHGDGSA